MPTRTRSFLTRACFVLATSLSLAALADQMNLTAPLGSVRFGTFVTALPGGNIVVTDPNFNSGAGAVYLYSPTGTLVSTLTGSTPNDNVGGADGKGITILATGHFVVTSPNWDSGADTNAGAVTWVNGVTGLPFGATTAANVVSASNSLIGKANDTVGNGGVFALPSGHYLVRSPALDNGATLNVGAVTWGNGTTGAVVGLVSATNSLIGSSTSDQVGSGGVVVLANGNYVVQSPAWRNGAAGGAGAVTWGSGVSGVRGAVSATNSLVGSIASDGVGDMVTPLTNGHYVVASPDWDGPQFANVGAVTWARGTGGTVGAVTPSNSLIGTSAKDFAEVTVIALTNGHYVVSNPTWRNGPIGGAGAATWGDGTKGTTGLINNSNSIVGNTVGDRVSSGGIVPLTNGHYVVVSDLWDNATGADAGAATWGDGTKGTKGYISSANSIVGTQAGDRVGDGGAVALSNGNYVVVSSRWSNGANGAAGGVTWGNGTTGTTGNVAATNSLCGDKAGDRVGSRGVFALTNGNYVVASELWDNGAVSDAGAVTWGNGASGVKGLVSPANSLVGSSADDNIGDYGYGSVNIVPLTNGNYVIVSPYWNNGPASDAGAVTWANGSAPITGAISAANSLIGLTSSAMVGVGPGFNQSVFPLPNGNYVITNSQAGPDGLNDLGAVTWGNGATGISGAITSSNSLVGESTIRSMADEPVIVLSNSDYIAPSSRVGVTLGDGGVGTFGSATSANSILFTNGFYKSISYNTAWQQLIVGQAMVNLVTLFTYPAPSVEVEQIGAALVSDGGSTDFGGVLTTADKILTFSVKNTGATGITNLAATLEGPDSAEFALSTLPAAALAPGASTTFELKFQPSTSGDKTAAIHLATSAPHESSFDLVVNGLGVTPVLPATVTKPATNVDKQTVTLNGTVDAKGSERTVVFQYGKAGTTINYTHEIAATPATVDGPGVQNVSADLTGLEAHTKYNFRVKASGFYGEAVGANLTFTTLDNAPVAVDDAFFILPGAKAALDVLANDTDADADVLTLKSYTALDPKAAGTLAKSGNNILFTPSATFTAATFNYTVTDPFKLTDDGQVNLTATTCTLSTDANTVLSASGSYTFDLMVTGDADAYWSVNESLSWLSVSPASGHGNATLTVTCQPNSGKADRIGVISVGGKTHTVTQKGVVIPSIDPPVVPLAVIGSFYTLTIPTTGAPVTYTVTNMPAGLKMDNATGILSGIPTKAINYAVKVKAANAAGPAPVIQEFNINVQALLPGVIGSFQGLVDREATVNNGLGSRIELTTTSLGGYTGKIITGTASQPLKGMLQTPPADLNHPKIVQQIKPGLVLDLTFNADDNNLAGTYGAAPVSAWRNTWTKDHKATAFATLHTFHLDQPDTDTAFPQGHGYGSFSVKDTTGALTIAGKLADGMDFKTTTFVGPQGQVLVYHPLYTNKGSLAGILTVTAGGTPASNTVAGSPDWFKPAPLPTSKDTVYRDGFDLSLTATGAAYIPPAKGSVVMALPNTADNARLDFTSGGLDTEGKEFGLTFSLLNPSPTGLTNKATIPSNPNTLTLPTITPATGILSGAFTIPGPTTALNRKVNYYGQIVGAQGYGFFLLPELPGAGQTLTTTKKHSGRAILKSSQ